MMKNGYLPKQRSKEFSLAHTNSKDSKNLFRGSFNNYVNKWRWVSGMSIVYPYNVNDLSLFTMPVY